MFGMEQLKSVDMVEYRLTTSKVYYKVKSKRTLNQNRNMSLPADFDAFRANKNNYKRANHIPGCIVW